MTLSKIAPPKPRGYRHLFTDQEIIDLYESNTLENMATLVSKRCGRKLSRETVRLWVVALAEEGLVTMGRFFEAPPVSKQRLSSLYLAHKKGSAEIARILMAEGIDTCPHTVLRWLRHYEVPTRTHREAAEITMAKQIKPRKLSDAQVLELFNQGMSHAKIAELLSEPGNTVYAMGARRIVLRAQKALGGELRPRIKNTWAKGARKDSLLSPIIAGSICPKCGADRSGTSGGRQIYTPSHGKNKGKTMERCAFKCRSCRAVWHIRAPLGWVATMKESGALPAHAVSRVKEAS